jgi:hypothetical protein
MTRLPYSVDRNKDFRNPHSSSHPQKRHHHVMLHDLTARQAALLIEAR